MGRRAEHAGSWYSGNGTKLAEQLNGWLDNAPRHILLLVPVPSLRRPAAAWAYKAIVPASMLVQLYSLFRSSLTQLNDVIGCLPIFVYLGIASSRVFILGPSHHSYREDCAFTSFPEYETPLGNLPVDMDTIKELQDTGKFGRMTGTVDEDEHSIEMHLPYIRHIFQGKDIKIVPILVGAISTSKEQEYGQILTPYLLESNTLFVISSDFCHWGRRFAYTYYSPSKDSQGVDLSRNPNSVQPTCPIHQSISNLDHEGMELISQTDTKTAHTLFTDYLNRKKNTICGRHPIGVLLSAMASFKNNNSKSSSQWNVDWVRYEQSSQAVDVNDSSVSYASAIITLRQD